MEALKQNFVLRSIGPLDVDRLVEMEEQFTGLCRKQWYERKTRHVEGEVHVSVGAELEGRLVGAMLGALRYGEFGVPEPVAVLDTVLVDRAYQGMGVATAMLERMAQNLQKVGVRRLRTELSWDEKHLNGFLTRRGFHTVRRVVMDLDVNEPSASGKGAAPRETI